MAERCICKSKIILIGDGGVGKTCFIKRYISGSFTREYNATVSADVHNLKFYVNPDTYIHFEVWDTAGQERNSGLSDAYYLGADAAIVFFDVTSRITHKNVSEWIRKVKNVNTENPNMPIVVVGNKADLSRDRKVDALRIKKGIPKGSMYTDMSAKSNYNFEKPLLYLARVLSGIPDLVFYANVNIAPPEIEMDQVSKIISEGIANEVEFAKHSELPDDDVL